MAMTANAHFTRRRLLPGLDQEHRKRQLRSLFGEASAAYGVFAKVDQLEFCIDPALPELQSAFVAGRDCSRCIEYCPAIDR